MCRTLANDFSLTKGVDGGEDLALRLKVVSEKYDVLLAAKEKAEAKYKEDYKKWKTFKKWLFDRIKQDELAEEKEKELTNTSASRSPFADTTNVFSVKGEVRASPITGARLHHNGTVLSSNGVESPTRRTLPRPVSPLETTVFNIPPPQLGGSKDFVQGCSKVHYEDSEPSREEAPKIRLGRYNKSKNRCVSY